MIKSDLDEKMTEFFHYLLDSGKWEIVQKELQAQAMSELVNAETPEESFKVALMVQLIPSVMQLVENQLTQ